LSPHASNTAVLTIWCNLYL